MSTSALFFFFSVYHILKYTKILLYENYFPTSILNTQET